MPDDPAQAEALMEGLDQAAAQARLDEAVATVRARAGGGPVGVLSWSMGGSLALAQAATGTEVEVQVWPGTEHSFANGDVSLHAPDAAAEAWAITVRFLRDRLAGAASG